MRAGGSLYFILGRTRMIPLGSKAIRSYDHCTLSVSTPLEVYYLELDEMDGPARGR